MAKYAFLLINPQTDRTPPRAESKGLHSLINRLRQRFDLVLESRDWFSSGASLFKAADNRPTWLARRLKSRRIKNIYIASLENECAVKAAALDARALGFNVFVIADACVCAGLEGGLCASGLAKLHADGVKLVESPAVLELAPPAAWRKKKFKVLCRGKHLTFVDRDTWEFVRRSHVGGVVGLVPITDNDELVLVEQFRPALDKYVIELPAGLAGDSKATHGEALANAARRELLEETGYAAGKLEVLAEGTASAGVTDEFFTLFKATGLKKKHDGGGDEHEDITVYTVPLRKLPEWLKEKQRAGVIIDLKLFTGLFLAGIDSKYRRVR